MRPAEESVTVRRKSPRVGAEALRHVVAIFHGVDFVMTCSCRVGAVADKDLVYHVSYRNSLMAIQPMIMMDGANQDEETYTTNLSLCMRWPREC